MTSLSKRRLAIIAVIAVNVLIGNEFNYLMAAFLAGVWLDREWSNWS